MNNSIQNRKPTIFLSSTCYDLKQVRKDLCEFIEDILGYQYLASEFPSFPVDPDVSTIENCKRRVENDADVLVLIVGNRYGSIPKGMDKSVTNLEYSSAILKNIPIFTFVNRDLLSILPVWEKNPEADYSNVVDNPKLFDFITEVRSKDLVWVFPFETAQDIKNILKTQFAYMMQRGLSVQARLKEKLNTYEGLSGEAFRLAIDKPDGWQGLLLCELVKQQIELHKDLKMAYRSEISFGTSDRIGDELFFSWIQSLMDEARRLIHGMTNLINKIMNTSINTSDIQLILYSSREIGNAYQAALNWALNIRRTFVSEKFRNYAYAVSLMQDILISELENFSDKLKMAINQILPRLGEEDMTLPFTITFDISNMENINKEFEKLKRQL